MPHNNFWEQLWGGKKWIINFSPIFPTSATLSVSTSHFVALWSKYSVFFASLASAFIFLKWSELHIHHHRSYLISYILIRFVIVFFTFCVLLLPWWRRTGKQKKSKVKYCFWIVCNAFIGITFSPWILRSEKYEKNILLNQFRLEWAIFFMFAPPEERFLAPWFYSFKNSSPPKKELRWLRLGTGYCSLCLYVYECVINY